MPENEHYSNPMAPANYRPHDEGESGSAHPLTNDDFRKLLMTPAAPGSSAAQRYHGSSSSASAAGAQAKGSTAPKGDGTTEAGDKRKKKKQYYAKVIREEKAREDERAKKYRDRARERRELTTTDDRQDQFDVPLPAVANPPTTSAGNYKSVAPDAKGNYDAAARRKQVIEESKFLGGDLEHTHLVKGLDYALLQKVRAEIDHDDIDDDQPVPVQEEPLRLKSSFKKPLAVPGSNQDKKKASSTDAPATTPAPITPEDEEEQRLGIKSTLARNIFRTLFRPPPRRINELFLPHRMAYIIDLEATNGQQDEENDRGSHTMDDIPTTLIRSKADCPNAETTTTMSNNDIVINKLTQILSYLRHSKRDLKRQKKKGIGIFTGLEPEMNIKPTHESVNTITSKTKDISMYDDIGDYIPDIKRRSNTSSNPKEKSQPDTSNRKRVYFNSETKFNDRQSGADEPEEDQKTSADSVKSFIRSVANKYNVKKDNERAPAPNSSKGRKNGFQLKPSDDSYAECYPGTMAEEDVNIDSDEEPDFEKMDMGSKKGPVGRWDFDTAEEYSDYMGQKEAMPKAAFQYGVKMNDGRKTRRGAGPKDEKQKIDREWQQISKIIESKRKGAPASVSDTPDISASKRAKMT